MTTKAEAGSRGGTATLHNQGKHKCPVCGHESDTGYYQAQGSKGGNETVKKHGRGHMARIAKRGGRPRRTNG